MTQAKILDTAIDQARRFKEAGADILDVGGESTRPGSSPVSEAEELDRVVPVIQAIAHAGFGLPISVDTYKANVARAALTAGATWINDVWGLKADDQMARIAKEQRTPLILMHNRSQPVEPALAQRLSSFPLGTEYDDLIEDIKSELGDSIHLAHQAGIPDDQIILDPGIGFGKTVEQNIEIIARLDEFRSMGYPILLGPSRKSFIGKTLDLPPDQRLAGTLAAVGVAIQHGADIIRVHDVLETVRFSRMFDALVRHRSPA